MRWAVSAVRTAAIPPACFRSRDTLHWEFVHDFYQSRREWTSVRDDCAVPDFFPLGDTHMLLCMSHDTGAHYYLGGWRNETFYPEGPWEYELGGRAAERPQEHAGRQWPAPDVGVGV